MKITKDLLNYVNLKKLFSDANRSFILVFKDSSLQEVLGKEAVRGDVDLFEVLEKNGMVDLVDYE